MNVITPFEIVFYLLILILVEESNLDLGVILGAILLGTKNESDIQK